MKRFLLLISLVVSTLCFWSQDLSVHAQVLRYDATGDNTVDVGDAVYISNLILKNLQNEAIDAAAPAQRQIRILDIGNSFSEDANIYLDGIVKASGADVSNIGLYMLYKSGSSFNYWVQNYRGNKTDKYYFRKVTGGLSVSVPCSHSTNGSCTDKDLLHNVLTQVQWDIIIIHQASLSCYNYSAWHGTNSEYGELDAFLDILHECQPQARIDFLLVHAPTQIVPKAGLSTTDQLWKKIMQSAKQIQKNDGIARIIPAGTALQSIRQTDYNDEYDLCRDGLHLAHGLARYTANCAYYQTVIAPITGVSIIGNTYRPSFVTADYNSSANSKPQALTDESALLAQIAGYMATGIWWQTINPEDYLTLFEDE